MVSLVVPIRNEENSLLALAESICAQTYLPAEVILVDGGSTDRTVTLAKELAGRDPRFRLIEVGDATPGRGRNIGAEAATNEWIAFTDAGIELEATWLERLAAVVEQDPGTDVVYGNFEPQTNTWFERCAALAYVPPKQMQAGRPMRGPSMASTLIRREAWQGVGGFPDLRAAEDLIFMERIAKAGYRTGWAPTATAWWQLQPTLGGTFRKFVLYSKHNVWAGRQRHWHYGAMRIYVVAITMVVLAASHSLWWALPLLLGAAVRVGKSIWTRRERRGICWACNPFQFAFVGVILFVIDLATCVGWIQALLRLPQPKAGDTESYAINSTR